jgi:hypothetical protein
MTMTVLFQPSFLAGVTLLLALQASGQVVFPEDELRSLPVDGSALTVTLPASTPIIAIATTEMPDGKNRHVLIWEPGIAARSWLYVPTRLTFFFSPTGGSVDLQVVNDEVTARGKGVRSLVWPEKVENWSLTDGGSPGGSDSRLLNLSVSTGSGCPSTTTSHWLQLRGGLLTELLRTGGAGEGGGDALWFEGSIVVWPGFDEGPLAKDVASSFLPVDDVPRSRRVIVYDVDIQAGVQCRAGRTLYRYAGGRLQRIREEQASNAAAGCQQGQEATTPTVRPPTPVPVAPFTTTPPRED